jgi:light-regulated signal transduction histidine kinase (bacteriophytochrome)
MDTHFPDPLAVPSDLTTCDCEPIDTPGHIQPHGVLVATAADDMRISHVSENAFRALGLRANALLGTDLEDLVGTAGLTAMRHALRDTSYAPASILRLTLPIPPR